MQIKPDNIKKILLVRNDRFGEFLLNIPVVSVLKQSFPEVLITLIVKPQVKELVGRVMGLSEVLVWDSPQRHTLREKMCFLKELSSRHFDLAIILNPSKEMNIFTYLAGIPRRIGYNRKWGFLLNTKIDDKKSEGLRHEVDYNLDLVRAIGVDADCANTKYSLDIRENDISLDKLTELGVPGDNIVALHPWASNREKEWPYQKFKELALRIPKELGLDVVVLGGPEEVKRAEDFCRGLKIVNLTGKTNLIELAGFLKRCRLLITNDSGPMHLASVVGTPVVAIFRRSPLAVSARRWGPVGKNCLIIDNDIISDIKVEDILSGIKKLL